MTDTNADVLQFIQIPKMDQYSEKLIPVTCAFDKHKYLQPSTNSMLVRHHY